MKPTLPAASKPFTRLPGPVVLIAALAIHGSNAEAQELITDRPDFTESAIVVPRGSTQVEGGLTLIEGEGDFEVLSGPELLVRWGWTDRIELRFGLPDWINPNRGPSGLGDGSLGAKWQLGPTASGWDVGLIGTVAVPIGEAGFTSDAFDPSLILTLGRDLASGWGLGTQVSAGRESAGDDEVAIWAGTLVVGRDLSSRIGVFVELAAENVEGEETALLAHHGYTFLARNNLQFDIHFGVGLSDGAPDSLIGAGVSWRSD